MENWADRVEGTVTLLEEIQGADEEDGHSNDAYHQTIGGGNANLAKASVGINSVRDRNLSVQNVEEEYFDRDNHKGEQGHANDDEDNSNEYVTLDEQLLENRKTWELAKESGAMLLNEEDDIMTILQEQNKEISQKRILAKQKAKARWSRPKNTKKVSWNIRGLRGDGKLRMVKELKRKHRLDMLVLVETKRQLVTRFDVLKIWGNGCAGWEYVESDGASGGLLLMWDDGFFKMGNCYKGERWLCVEGILAENSINCAFFLVYGAHTRDEKRVVWEELSYIAGLCPDACCFLGDFNEIG
ncbi:hypothetical protein AHAS_Ahas20G0090100 [Arachis hypogaea]